MGNRKAESNVPELRFPGFTDPWEQRKLGAVAKKVTLKNVDCAEKEVLTNSAELGIISQADYFDREIAKEESISGYYLVEEGDFVYNPRISSNAPVGPIKRNELGRRGVVSPLYTVFRIAEHVDGLFLAQFFDTTRWHKFMKLEGNTGARADRFSIGDKMFFEMPIPVPSLPEQRAIGALFRDIDDLLALRQRELEDTQQLKRGLLQKMFPKDGADVPELRFPGFTDPWEQRKFGSIATLRRGLTYSPKDIAAADNGVRVLRSSNINDDQFELHENDVFVGKDAVNIEPCRNGDILITASNGSTDLVGKHALISHLPGETVHGGFMLLASADEPYFTNAIMSTSWYQRFLKIGVTGGNGSLGNLDKNALENSRVSVPSLLEQRAIGALFRDVDDLIALRQRELDHVKMLKKALLQQMFV